MIRALYLDLMMIMPRMRIMLGIMVILCLWLTFQMHAFPATFAAAIFMSYPMIAMSLRSYDELKGWDTYRMTLPVSRRDVVVGRYLLMAALAVEGVLVACIVTGGILLTDAIHAVLRPGSSSLLPREMTADGMIQTTAVITFVCLLVFTMMTGIATPLFYRFGMTKVTMMLPYIFIVGMLALFALVGDRGRAVLEAVPDMFAWLATTPGALIASGALLAATIGVMVVSAAVSLRVYKRAEL